MAIREFEGVVPRLEENVYVDPSAQVIGAVTLAKGCSVWPAAVLRGDTNSITVGAFSNIQDGTVIHVSSYGFSAKGKKGSPTIISDYVTIGHNATIHACEIGKNALIGMGSVILDQSKIEDFAFIAAGAIVPPGSKVGTRELWAGNPARFVRKISDTEERLLINTPDVYYNLSQEFLKK